jgi:hypothetical protein
MTATTNGATVEVLPIGDTQVDGADAGFSTFAANNIALPGDGKVGIVLDGAVATIDELPAFAVHGPTGEVSRAAGKFPITWDPVDGTAVELHLVGRCKTDPFPFAMDMPLGDLGQVPNTGSFIVDVSVLAIPGGERCDLAVVVMQKGAESGSADLVTSAVQVRQAAFTSVP